MIVTAAALGGLGLVCMLVRRTVLGMLVGLQLLILGGTSVFVMAGAAAGDPVDGHVFGLFVTIGGVAQLVVGYALAVRLFYLKKKAGMDELRSLRH
jgi:NADH:ubiquinone oxidoreductase subunit K